MNTPSSHATLLVSHVSFAYPGSAHEILHDVTASFPHGWTAVVGDNGRGKSTLARLICAHIVPTTGNVSGPALRVLCAQEATIAPDELEAFACDYDSDAIRLRADLSIADDMPWRFSELSSGEQKKLQVAVALWQRPDVLVLDEPTNHLDEPARRALLCACAQYGGIGIVISHDRTLLDTLARQCLCFEGDERKPRVVMRPGPYGEARVQADRERAETIDARHVARSESRRLAREAQRRAEVASRDASLRSARTLGTRDSDAREKIGRAIVSGKDARATRAAGVMAKRAERAGALAAEAYVDRRYDGSLWLDARPHARKVLVRLDSGPIPLGSAADTIPGDASREAFLNICALHIGNADHIGIEGPNGAGKSTLVRHLVRMVPPDITACYLPQEISDAASRKAIKRLRKLTSGNRGKLLSMVAQLNSDPGRINEDVLEGSGMPSPGELRKLLLAECALNGAPLLIMDEPTNNLDLHSVEALEQALAAFPGAFVVVSHDASLLQTCTSRRWHVEDGTVTER